MGRHWTIHDAPKGTCNHCGWTGRDWAFKYQGLCSKCYKKWKKEQQVARQKLKKPNDNVEIGEGIIVTRNVEKRLIQRSQRDIPIAKRYELMEWFSVLAVFIIAVAAWFAQLNLLWLLVIPLAILTIIIVNKKKESALDRRSEMVNARTQELAIERKTKLEEAKEFYSSAEWRIARRKIIKRHGKRCEECGEYIDNDFDLTVDHIKPRSIFPDEALKLSNLRVLCRKCNSKKGASIINESDVGQDDDSPLLA